MQKLLWTSKAHESLMTLTVSIYIKKRRVNRTLNMATTTVMEGFQGLSITKKIYYPY